MLSLFDSSYLVILLGWRITHFSPLGPRSEPLSLQNCYQANHWLWQGSAIFIMGKEGNSPLKSIKCRLQICPTLSPSWGGASPTLDPRGPYQSPKVTRGTTKRTFITALARDAWIIFWRHLLSTSKSTAAPLNLFNDSKGSLQPAVWGSNAKNCA